MKIRYTSRLLHLLEKSLVRTAMMRTCTKGLLFALLLILPIIVRTSTALGADSTVTFLSSLDDEKAAYRLWGWSWQPNQEPSIPNGPYSITGHLDVHNDLENDDLQQNIDMWKRT